MIYRHKRYLSKGLSIDFSVEFVGLRGLFIRRRRANLRKDAVFGRYGGGLNDQSPPDRGRSTVAPASHVDYAAFKKGASTAESQLSLAHARRVHHLRRSLAMEESGLHMTRRWREGDSNPRSPVRGRTLVEPAPFDPHLPLAARGTEGSNPAPSSGESVSRPNPPS